MARLGQAKGGAALPSMLICWAYYLGPDLLRVWNLGPSRPSL